MIKIRVFAVLIIALLFLSLAPSDASAISLKACRATAPASQFNTQEMQLASCYEKEVGATHMMLLDTDFPSWGHAVSMGNTMAASLKAWAKAEVTPLVIFDPTLNGNGSDYLNLNDFKPGNGDTYYNALSIYFQTLKKDGITTKEMGIWVPFDEPNLPQWYEGIVTPSLFIQNYIYFSENIRAVYPDANLSVLLSSQTCQTNWTNCVTPSPYQPKSFSEDIEPYLLSGSLNLATAGVSSFGFSGFTWTNSDSAAQFMNSDIIADSANTLGVKNVWFNTGTYQEVDFNNSLSKATLSRRAQVLNEILAEASQIQSQGLRVEFINLFSQNVLDGNGTANYSYNYKEKTQTESAAATSTSLNDLRIVIEKARLLKQPVPVAIFDAE